MKASFLSLNWQDFAKGLIVAILTAVFATVTTLLQTGELFKKESLPVIGVAALTAFLGYIGKNFLTNSQNQFATTEENATKEKVAPLIK